MAGALFFILSSTAQAQEEQVRVTVSGRIELTYAHRDGTINEAAVWTPGGLAAGDPIRRPDSFVLPDIAIRFDLEGSEWTATLEAGTLPLEFDSFDPRLQNERLGEPGGTGIDLRQAWLELFGAARLGLQDLVWDPAGAHPLFLAPSRAESPWEELPDSTVPPFPASGTNTVPQTRRDTRHPVGLSVRVSGLTFFALVAGEGGRPAADEMLAGAIGEFSWRDFRFAALAVLLAGAEHEQAVGTGGAGIVYSRGDFSAAVEGYLQRGRAGRDLRAEGNAVRLSARYAPGPWIQATALRVSGDERGDDGQEGRFLSYEDNDATMIVEGNEFGLDIDSNYAALQISAGTPFELAGRTWRPRALAAFFTFLGEVPLPPDPPFGVGSRSRVLGTEVDAAVDLEWSQGLTFTASAALLFRAEALESFTRDREQQAWLLTAGVRLAF